MVMAYKNIEEKRAYNRKYQRDNREIIRAKKLIYYANTRDVHLAKCREWQERNRERSRKAHAKYYQENKDWLRLKNKEWIAKNKDRYTAAVRAYRLSIRIGTLAAYGNKCACCGESEKNFLTIDHIDGKGHEHRKLVGSGHKMYCWLRRNGYPKDNYRLLCWNCNSAIGAYGYCPHRPQQKELF